jgi:hypothetical protein
MWIPQIFTLSMVWNWESCEIIFMILFEFNTSRGTRSNWSSVADLFFHQSSWLIQRHRWSWWSSGQRWGGQLHSIQLDIRQIPLTIGERGKRSTAQFLAGVRGTVADLGETKVVSSRRLALRLTFSSIQLPQHQTERGQIISLDLQHTSEAQRTASMFAQIKSMESSVMNNLQFKVTCDASMTGVPFSLVPPLSHLQCRLLSDLMRWRRDERVWIWEYTVQMNLI